MRSLARLGRLYQSHARHQSRATSGVALHSFGVASVVGVELVSAAEAAQNADMLLLSDNMCSNADAVAALLRQAQAGEPVVVAATHSGVLSLLGSASTHGGVSPGGSLEQPAVLQLSPGGGHAAGSALEAAPRAASMAAALAAAASTHAVSLATVAASIGGLRRAASAVDGTAQRSVESLASASGGSPLLAAALAFGDGAAASTAGAFGAAQTQRPAGVGAAAAGAGVRAGIGASSAIGAAAGGPLAWGAMRLSLGAGKAAGRAGGVNASAAQEAQEALLSSAPPTLPGRGNHADAVAVESAASVAAGDVAAPAPARRTAGSGADHRPLLPASAADATSIVAAAAPVDAATLRQLRRAVIDAAGRGDFAALARAIGDGEAVLSGQRSALGRGGPDSDTVAGGRSEVVHGGCNRPVHNAGASVGSTPESGLVATATPVIDGPRTAPSQHAPLLVRWHDEEHGATPLHSLVSSAAALSDEDAEEVRQCMALLLRCGADVNAPAGNGSTPLHWAAGAGAEPAVRALVESGANPMVRSYTWRRQVFGKGSGQLPVHWAAESNHTAIVRYLTSVCLPCGLAIDERGTTPAQAAAKELAFGAEAALRKIEAQPLFFLRFSLRSSFAAALQRGAPGRDGDAGRMRKAHSYIEGASTTEGAAT